MPLFKVAHLREQATDLIIVVLDSSMANRSDVQQRQTAAEVQIRARSAGMYGVVVPVWFNAGRLEFVAPPEWQAFFAGLTPEFVLANVNRELYWRGQSQVATWLGPEGQPRPSPVPFPV